MPAMKALRLPKISEREFQSQVRQLATIFGWRVYHTFDSRHSDKGFPDLVCVRRNRVVFMELKTEDGKVKPEQQQWRQLLGAVGGNVEYILARPSMWNELVEVLT